MKKNATRLAALLLALLLCACLCACGGGDKELSFTNDTGATITELYISDTNSTAWGDKLNLSDISDGSSISFNFSDLGEDAQPGVYDVGALDDSAWNYDVYGVSLAVGDSITLGTDGTDPVITVTTADGVATTYTGTGYAN